MEVEVTEGTKGGLIVKILKLLERDCDASLLSLRIMLFVNLNLLINFSMFLRMFYDT